jgi:hypothetical protein
VAAQRLGFVWLGLGVIVLIVLYSTGRRPELSGLNEEGQAGLNEEAEAGLKEKGEAGLNEEAEAGLNEGGEA